MFHGISLFGWTSNPPKQARLSLLAIAVLASGQIGCIAKTETLTSGSNHQRSDPAKSVSAASSSAQQTPSCPVLDPHASSIDLQTKGGHQVILSWKPSAPANAKHASAFGYCIYRSTGRKNAPLEVVNSSPFDGTSCADDLVENGKKYYYTVRAISAKGATSITSNVAPAPIPNRPRPADAPQTSVPLCRAKSEK